MLGCKKKGRTCRSKGMEMRSSVRFFLDWRAGRDKKMNRTFLDGIDFELHKERFE